MTAPDPWRRVASAVTATPIVIARTREASYNIESKLFEMAQTMGRYVIYYSPLQGLRWFNPQKRQWHQAYPPGTDLGVIIQYLCGGEGGFNAPYILMWDYPHRQWGGDGEEAITTYAINLRGHAKTMVMVCTHGEEIPSHIQSYATVINLPVPVGAELEGLVWEIIRNSDELEEVVSENVFDVEDKHVPQMVQAMRGLTLAEAERIVRQAYDQLPDDLDGRYLGSNQFWSDWIEMIQQERAAQSEARGLLAKVDTRRPVKIDGVDGFKHDMARLLQQGAFRFGQRGDELIVHPDFPSGIALVGLPGTAKTRLATWLGHYTQLPVYKLMIGSRGNGTVGDSARKMRMALDEAKSNGPCILFIDEANTVFDGEGGGDSGDKKEMVGQFLNALSGELKESGVTVLLAYNKPPENSALTRSGRIDKKYFFEGQTDIMVHQKIVLAVLENQVAERRRYYEAEGKRIQVDKEAVRQAIIMTRGWVGGDVEQLLKNAFSYGDGYILTVEGVRRARHDVTPVTEDPAMQRDIKAIRDLGGQYKNASGAVKQTAPQPAQRPAPQAPRQPVSPPPAPPGTVRDASPRQPASLPKKRILGRGGQ